MDILNKKINFHIHTKYSFDSLLEPSFIVDYLFQNGFDAAIITDHNTIKGAVEAQEYATKKYKDKFTVIIGEEVKSDIGDIIGFPLEEEVEPGDWETVVMKMKQQGAFLCLPHPYKSHNLFLIHQEEFINQFDFIEIFNARINDKLNEHAFNLAEKYKKIKIVGNDAHVKSDLLNCSNYYDGSLETPVFTTNKTHLRNVRHSQIINYYKKRNIAETLKYSLLYFIGK
ncbi:PHP domain-containing protein [Ignavibacterium sp.]|uniref:PHP domain-containing protein n=1 Tax=Ignavibacterium sp. TaxID=2651167 RepID=UPI0022052C87|nr:PHP domain-containing protein [Ignavibacterium sp.]BDQ02787.1 MAG: PHP domain-containing protein [Ignavibacterium sp.]